MDLVLLVVVESLERVYVEEPVLGDGMTLGFQLLSHKASVIAAQAGRRRRRQLQRELATYSSAADMADLAAMVARYPDEQTGEIRSLLMMPCAPAPLRDALSQAGLD